MVKITINEQEVEVEEGNTILEVAQSLGIDIPTLCYHKALSPYGACRLCTVEIELNGKTMYQASCEYLVQEGMIVKTNTERVIKGRKKMVELLLARAPEVEAIKELAKRFGIKDTRIKKKYDDCILCGLCIRVCNERMGFKAINFVNRGINREVSLPFENFREVCRTCGACSTICPTDSSNVQIENLTPRHPEPILSEFDEGLTLRPVIYTPFPQAVPKIPVIDRENCIQFLTGECGICETVCIPEAINFEQEDEILEKKVGAIIVATGFDTFDPQRIPQYGYGKYPNVITSLEFERFSSASGPTEGEIITKDGKQVKSVAIVHCVGSRDINTNLYCSRLCCMNALKDANLIREKLPNSTVYEFYIDIRATGKGYEEYYHKMLESDIRIIRGKVAEITNIPDTPKDEGRLIVVAEDTLLGEILRVPVDLVILMVGLEPRRDAKKLSNILHLPCTDEGFYIERHPKLAPTETVVEGIHIAGACQFPKDITDTVAQGESAAAAVLSKIQKGEHITEPTKAQIIEDYCSGCRNCIGLCEYMAISFNEEKKIAEIDPALCTGCGVCVASCPSGAILHKGYTDKQIFAEIEGILADR
ncbi:MAG: 2Fe-2S iron-sulfur cluster-binding protein [Candidatus Heimdallarchaeaceae archaeon]